MLMRRNMVFKQRTFPKQYSEINLEKQIVNDSSFGKTSHAIKTWFDQKIISMIFLTLQQKIPDRMFFHKQFFHKQEIGI